MKIPSIAIAAGLVGAALGATGSQALRAQVAPAAFVAGEIDVENAPAYFKEYVPVATKAVSEKPQGYVINVTGEVVPYADTRVRISCWRMMSSVVNMERVNMNSQCTLAAAR